MAGTPCGDGELVVRAQAGDDRAVCDLYHRHAGTVRAAVARRLRDRDLVEEVVQEAFTRAIERLTDLRRPERFRAWVMVIARNTANDRWRLERRQLDLDPEVLETVTDTGPGPDEATAAHLLADLVAQGIGRLNERDAAALRLATDLGLAPTEVGAALGLSSGAAKVAVHRARRRLRTKLAVEVLLTGDRLACAGAPAGWVGADDAERHVAGCRPCLDQARAELVGRAA